ncbi:hypothetical protein MPSI1_000367 [Malassezia psittaci]|uniref:Uncharacterized protein n=1 Tax=Malassezia psittaci TaxID=1821823 RepID=A0AAF0JII7_9BASI|nr:hypothetical protein MPSI1_000367 [Malassezia psittaci]
MLRRARSVRTGDRACDGAKVEVANSSVYQIRPTSHSRDVSTSARKEIPTSPDPTNAKPPLSPPSEQRFAYKLPLFLPQRKHRVHHQRSSTATNPTDAGATLDLLPAAELHDSSERVSPEGLGILLSSAQSTALPKSPKPMKDPTSPTVQRSRSFRSYFHRRGRRKHPETLRDDLHKQQGSLPGSNIHGSDLPVHELSTVLQQGSRAVERRQHTSNRSFSSPLQESESSRIHVNNNQPTPIRRHANRSQETAVAAPFTFPLQQTPFTNVQHDLCSTPPSLTSSSSTLTSDHASPSNTFVPASKLPYLNDGSLQSDRTTIHSAMLTETLTPAPPVILSGSRRQLLSPPRSTKEDAIPVWQRSGRLSPWSAIPSFAKDAPVRQSVGAERGLVIENPESQYESDALRSQRASMDFIASGDGWGHDTCQATSLS